MSMRWTFKLCFHSELLLRKSGISYGGVTLNISELAARMSFIFGVNNKNRYHIEKDEEGTPVIVINYHELKVSEGRKYLNNIIAVLRNGCRIEIIHGFNHGTAAAYFNIGEKALRRLAENKELHLAMMFGNKWLFIREDVEKYLMQCATENECRFRINLSIENEGIE